MNLSKENLQALAMNLHMQIEVAKLNGQDPKTAAVQERDETNSIDAMKAMVSDIPVADRGHIKEIMKNQMKQMTETVNYMYVLVTQDVDGICSGLGMDMEYAKAFMEASREALKEVEADIEAVFDEPVKTVRKPVLLS